MIDTCLIQQYRVQGCFLCRFASLPEMHRFVAPCLANSCYTLFHSIFGYVFYGPGTREVDVGLARQICWSTAEWICISRGSAVCRCFCCLYITYTKYGRFVTFYARMAERGIVIYFNHFAEARRLLQIKPMHRKQQENFDRVLKCVTHLIYLLVETSKTREEKAMVRKI